MKQNNAVGSCSNKFFVTGEDSQCEDMLPKDDLWIDTILSTCALKIKTLALLMA